MSDVPKINWTLIAKLPADDKVYPGGPEYGAYRVSHTAETRHNVECLLAETGVGLYRRRLVPAGKGKPKKWGQTEWVAGRLGVQTFCL